MQTIGLAECDAWMWLEGENNALATLLGGYRAYAVEQYTVSAVYAIERTDSRYTATKLRKIVETAENSHFGLVVAILLVLLNEVGHLFENGCNIVVFDHDALREVE